MKAYEVIGNIQHNGKKYAEGHTIDLNDANDAEAKELREAGVIGREKTQSAPTAPPDDAKRITAIVDAIGKLNVDSADLWTGNGIPKTDALTALTGWPVTGKDRDIAWAQVQAAKG